MKALLARLRGLWHAEPVLVGSALPVLVTLGVLSQDQASVLTNAIASVATVAAQVAVAFKVRSKVKPT